MFSYSDLSACKTSTRDARTAGINDASTAAPQGVTLWMAWPTKVSPQAVGVAFAFAAATGVFFGFYPARKATALDPIDALRFE